MNSDDLYNLILENVSRFIDLTRLEKQKFISLLTPITVGKREFLMQAGDITSCEYFITKGCLKVYTLDPDGVPHISMLAKPLQGKPFKMRGLFISALVLLRLLCYLIGPRNGS